MKGQPCPLLDRLSATVDSSPSESGKILPCTKNATLMPQVRILCKQIWPHNVVTKILQTLYIQNTLCVSEHRCEKQHHTINFCQVHSSFFTPQMLFSVSSHLVLTCLYFHRGVSPLPSRKINSVFLPPPLQLSSQPSFPASHGKGRRRLRRVL